MQVILRENVENLGQIGDIVKVNDGYARNFLIPRNLVVIADEKNMAQVEHHKRGLEKRRLEMKSAAEELAKKLEEFSCTLSRKVGEKDKLFGSVTAHDISEAIQKAGYKVGKGDVQLIHPIKTLGVHTVTVRLSPEVNATMKVWVVKQE